MARLFNWLIIGAGLVFVLVACSDAGDENRNSRLDPVPALKPASSLLAGQQALRPSLSDSNPGLGIAGDIALGTPSAGEEVLLVRPPTATPQLAPPQSAIAPSSSNQVALPTPENPASAGLAGGVSEEIVGEVVQAPNAAWRIASLAEETGDLTAAVDGYLSFAASYPASKDADEALFRAGYLSWRMGENDRAKNIWREATSTYLDQQFGAASLLWLFKNSSGEEADHYLEIMADVPGQSYYAHRSRHLANGVEPFQSLGEVSLFTGDAGRDSAESWLRDWLGLDAGFDVATFSEEMASDDKLIRGEDFWQMGRRQKAQRELESLRVDYAHDALASYQLALYFRDLGLYRSSILAATSVMELAGVDVSEAPRFIGRLAYPAYYADLVLAEARKYDYDPLLQLAKIREECLFESFATSPAGARGLSQILPDGGDYIAQQLAWPDYTRADLYYPPVAIAFGAFFLNQQLDAFDGNVAAALAAYNAGPGYAAGWYEQGSEDFDIFLEAVDFPETHRYIEQIYLVQSTYRYLYS